MKKVRFDCKEVNLTFEGKKTQYLKIVKFPSKDIQDRPDDCFQPVIEFTLTEFDPSKYWFFYSKESDPIIQIPVEIPWWKGDLVFVQEPWQYGYIDASVDRRGEYKKTFVEYQFPNMKSSCSLFYNADHVDDTGGKLIKWRSSMQMPEEASRLKIKISNVRIDRIHDLKLEDIVKEGYPNISVEEFGHKVWDKKYNNLKDRRKFGWDKNPWVWIVDFERL